MSRINLLKEKSIIEVIENITLQEHYGFIYIYIFIYLFIFYIFSFLSRKKVNYMKC